MRLSLLPLLAAFALVPPAQAAIIHVDSGTDNGVGCTLREALRAARDDAPFGGCTAGISGSDTIVLNVSSITLFSTLDIESTVVINGNTGGLTTIEQTQTGGNVFFVNSSVERFEFLNLRVTGGEGPSGAGVYMGGGSSLGVIRNSTFEGNTAALRGGAIAAFGNSSLLIKNTTFIDNRALGSPAQSPDTGGGAIYFDGDIADINGSTFISNRALTGDGGGAIYATGSASVGVTGSQFTTNRTRNEGGAILSDGLLILSNTTFDGNTALDGISQGGAVAARAGADIDDSTFLNNSADTGGGVYCADSLELTGVLFDGNRAVGEALGDGGAGVYCAGTDITVEGGEFVGNRAFGVRGVGGGVFLNGGSLVVSGGTVFRLNRAQRGGGAIDVQGDALVTISQASLTENVVSGGPGDGGAIRAVGADAEVYLTGLQFSDNEAKGSGGAVWAGEGARLDVFGGEFANNFARGQAEGEGGGAIAVTGVGGPVLIRNATFTRNEAKGLRGVGGAIVVDEATVQFRSLAMLFNRGNSGGGGLAILDGGTVDWVSDAPGVTLSTVLGNTTGRAPGHGGGIYIPGDGSLSISEARIADNEAWNQGGALWASGTSDVTLFDVWVEGNAARREGGGIYLASGGANDFTVTQALFEGNSTPQRGGGFFAATDARVAIRNTTFTANTARLGAAAFSTDAVLQFDSATIAGNTAEVGGGGLGNTDGPTRPVRLKNTIVADNAPNDLQGRFGSDGDNMIGTSPSPVQFDAQPSDFLATDPLLLALADNGGFTKTMALASGSPAVNAGSTTLQFDQRGYVRTFPITDTDDIGAFEQGSIPPSAQIASGAETAPVARAEADASDAEPVRLGAVTPNPVAGRSRVTFSVAEAQPVTVSLVDMMGRRVRSLYDGTPTAGEPVQVTIEAAGLASGVYVIVLNGETVRATRRVSIVR